MAQSVINVLVALNSYEILKCASHLMCCRCANHLCSAFGQAMGHMHAISQLHACMDLLHFLQRAPEYGMYFCTSMLAMLVH